MDVRLAWTGCDEAGDYVVPNVLSPRDQVSRPDKMNETVLHTQYISTYYNVYLRKNRKCLAWFIPVFLLFGS